MKEEASKKMKNILITYKFFVYLFIGAGFLISGTSYSQTMEEEQKKIEKQTNKFLKEAEEKLGENDFASAEASYRKAVAKNPDSEVARYNMANMYYGKEKSGNATQRYIQAAEVSETKDSKHKIFHNLGNTFMEQKKYKEAVEAYKNALRSNPSDEETRYNLALAKKMLEEEEKDGGGGDDDQQDKDEGEKDKEKDQKGDEGEKDQDKKNGEENEDKGGDKEDESKKEPEKEDENGDPKDQKKDEGKDGEKEQPQQPQPQPGQLSPQQIKSLLEAMNNEEKKVQDKINAQKAQGAKTRTGKDW
ncbi:tetratricopeptide repeat protein [Gillisia sp. Q332]|uniref:tetratricopeptide repeat protein n=1 Tax=Gillisia xinjiangensis TaxID=3384765 RepID=UPI00391CCCBB